MEQRVGAQLFERTRVGVRPTLASSQRSEEDTVLDAAPGSFRIGDGRECSARSRAFRRDLEPCLAAVILPLMGPRLEAADAKHYLQCRQGLEMDRAQHALLPSYLPGIRAISASTVELPEGRKAGRCFTSRRNPRGARSDVFGIIRGRPGRGCQNRL